MRGPDPLRRLLVGPGPVGPWIDDAITAALTRWYFPLSRAWAAALAADGSVADFLAAQPLARRPPTLARRLRALAGLNRAHRDATARWEAAFFDAPDPPPSALAAAQGDWLVSARALMRGRGALAAICLLNRVPPVRWDVAPPEAVAARHGARRADPDRAFVLPEALPGIAESRPLLSAGRRDCWLRFASPVAGDMAWAELAEPAGGTDVPTVIFMHGLAVDPEYAPDPHEVVTALLRRGIRVLRPTAPWHGRRRPEGFYGGEAAIARGPLGLLESLHAAAVEAGIWTAWARARSGGAPVALGGFSFGALTAQMAGAAAHGWPDIARPDALLLVATGGDAARSLFEGGLSRGLGAPRALLAAGWTRERLAEWSPLLEPHRPPAVPPARILAHLGSADRLTFCGDALAMLRRWGVPDGNITVVRKGHYTASFDAAADPRPLARLAALLGR